MRMYSISTSGWGRIKARNMTTHSRVLADAEGEGKMENDRMQEYQFSVKITLRTPIVRDYVRMMTEAALKNMNVSVLMGQDEKPESVEVTIRK